MNKENKSSRISGFYKMSIEERREYIKRFSDLSDKEIKNFYHGLGENTADKMIENVIGTYEFPLGVAVNFLIDGKDYILPMAIEESSVIAAASNAAKVARIKGGFKTEVNEPLMIGQLQVLKVEDIASEAKKILEKKEELLKIANQEDKVLVDLGGGAKDIEVRILDSPLGKMIVVHLIVDVRDAMGANAVNSMCEAVAPMLEELTGGRVRLKILSNLADKRLAKAEAVFDKEKMGGEDAVDAFLESYTLASIDPYRAATHNKGIMNGIDALLIAMGNDFRAVEAGAHAYASRNGRYTSLTEYHKNAQGDLVGKIELPVAVGVIGGAASMHPTAQICKKILDVENSSDLARVVASLGLAQNFAAVYALSTVGIQKGHMSLHAKNVAVMAGAKDDEIDMVADKLVEMNKVKLETARKVLKDIR